MTLHPLYTHAKKNYPQIVPFLISSRHKELDDLRFRYQLTLNEEEKQRITERANEIKQELQGLQSTET